mgnify:CR=1 FL=1
MFFAPTAEHNPFMISNILTRIFGSQAEKYEAVIVPLADPAAERPFAAEIAGRMVDLQYSDSLAPPSAIVMAFFEAVGDGSLLVATRDTLMTAFAGLAIGGSMGCSYTHLRAHETVLDLVCRLFLEKKKTIQDLV